MRGRARDGREEGEPAGQGASSLQPFGVKSLTFRSQLALGHLDFLICEMKAPTSLTAETLTGLQVRMTLCAGPGAPLILGRLLPGSAPQFPTSKWGHGFPRAPTWPSCWKKKVCVH